MTIVGRRASNFCAVEVLGFTRRNNSSNSAWRTFKLAERVCGDCCGACSKMLLQRQLRQTKSASPFGNTVLGRVYHRLANLSDFAGRGAHE